MAYKDGYRSSRKARPALSYIGLAVLGLVTVAVVFLALTR